MTLFEKLKGTGGSFSASHAETRKDFLKNITPAREVELRTTRPSYQLAIVTIRPSSDAPLALCIILHMQKSSLGLLRSSSFLNFLAQNLRAAASIGLTRLATMSRETCAGQLRYNRRKTACQGATG